MLHAKVARMGKSDPKIPPQDIDMERSLLGALMLSPNAIYEVADLVGIDSFYTNAHRTIYDAMLSLYEKSEPIDVATVSSKLKERKVLAEVGGAAYLSELIGAAASPGSGRHYAQIVQNKFVLRSLLDAAAKIGELGFEEDRDIEVVLDEAQAAIFAVSQAPSLRSFTALKDELTEAWERLEHLQKHEDSMRGIPTGFRELDTLLSGLQKSDLIILAARPSMGKTALALDIARQTATKHGTAVGIFSLEMSSQQLVDRMLAAQAGVNSWRLRTGKIRDDDDFERLQAAMADLSEAPIFIDDKPSSTVLAMRSVARRLKMEKDLGLIIVDYLQLITPTYSRGSDNLVQQITEISRSLKAMARELEVPVLALSQLSRAVETRRGRPRLSDLRDSGCLAGETLIQRADTGERVPIRDLIGQSNIPIYATGEDMKLHCTAMSRVFSSGRKKLYTLTTRSGRRVRASGNHPFSTIDGWKRLDQIIPGTAVALPRILSGARLSNASLLSHDELILLAHLLGDGCVLPRQPIHYTSADEANLVAVEEGAARLFSITPRRVQQDNWWHSYLPSPYRLARGKRHPITLWFERLGIKPVRSYEKKIPAAVFASSDDDIALFLHHLWATDGNISSVRTRDGEAVGAAIYFASTSEELSRDVQHLLLRLGIWSTLRKVAQGAYRPNWHVVVQGKDAQLKFLQQVGCHGQRGDAIPLLIDLLERVQSNPNTDIIPRSVWLSAVAAAKKESGLSWRAVAEKLSIAYNGSAIRKSGISRARMDRLAVALKSETLVSFATSDLYWDEVVSIEAGQEEEVFDATVPDLYNFVANDFIVHNSIEQDADVVMFIHREDKMNENSDRPGIAEILVEKHRNGPVGKIELRFDEEKTTFRSIDKSDFGDFTPEAIVAAGDETPF